MEVMVKVWVETEPVDYETGTIIWENLELMHNMLFSINSSRNEVNPF
jgi:hypothetical protein